MSESRRVRVTSARGDWYEHPAWYDILHTPGTAAEVDGLERIVRRYVRTRGTGALRWFEPGCGTGRYLRVAGGRGAQVVGLDASERMIAYARRGLARRGISGELSVGDMTRFGVKQRADFAFCPNSTIRHLMDDQAVLDHLACVARALKRGGVYAVGLDLAMYGKERRSTDVWEGARGRCRVRQVVQYEPGGRCRRREGVVSHLLVRTPGREHRLETRYELRTYSDAQWEGLIERSALRIVGVCDGRGGDLGWGGRESGGGTAAEATVFVLGLR